MENKTSKTIITGVSILLLTTGLFFVSRAIIAKIKRNKEDDNEIIDDGDNGDDVLAPSEEAEAKNYNPASDAKFIYDRISGWKVPFVYYDTEINALIARLTNAKLKKMATYYKTKYKKSLWLALDEEWDYFSGNQYQGAMNRLSNLGLR